MSTSKSKTIATIPPITSTTPGVISTSGRDVEGLTLVVGASKGRLNHPKFQLVLATGGNGCKPGNIGTGIFMRQLYIEHPEGSGKIVRNSEKFDDEIGNNPGEYKGRCGEVIGEASADLLRYVEALGSNVEPADPDDFCVLAQAAGSWVKRNTVKEALQGLGKRGLKDVLIAVVHREAAIDFGSITTPGYAVKKGRKNVVWIADGEMVPASLAIAEQLAAKAIAEAKGAA